MDSDAIYAGVNELFADIFMRDDLELGPETTAAEVDGWDSFKMIEIIMGLEEKYHFKFDTREIDNLNNVGDLVAVIARKGSA